MKTKNRPKPRKIFLNPNNTGKYLILNREIQDIMNNNNILIGHQNGKIIIFLSGQKALDYLNDKI